MLNLKGAHFTNAEVADSFTRFIHDLARHNDKVEQMKKVRCFVFVLYNEGDEYFRKVFNDREFWEALDKKTGEFLAVIAYAEKLPAPSPALGFMVDHPKHMNQSFDEINSKILKDVFGLRLSSEEMPALLVFSLGKDTARIEIGSLKPENKDDAYKIFRDLVSNLAKALKNVDRKALEIPGEVMDIARHSLESQVTFLELKRGLKSLKDFSVLGVFAKKILSGS